MTATPVRNELSTYEWLQLRTWRGGLVVLSGVRGAGAPIEMRGLGLTEHAYGPHPLEQLDRIAKPAIATPAGVLVYIHGGGWVSGSRKLVRCDVAAWAQRGHVVFNLDYPLAPEAPFPVGLSSVVRALAWIREREPGAESVAIAGDSAGGNLATMAAAVLEDKALLEEIDPTLAELELPTISKVVSIYGVMDRFSWLGHAFPAARMFMRSYGGAAAFEREVRRANAFTPLDLPITRLPPIFLAGAAKDPLCPSTRLAHEAFRAKGIDARLELYPTEGHGFFNMPYRKASWTLKRDIAAFLAAS